MSDRLKAEREAAAARRNLLTQDAIERTGITEEMIGELVTRFYGRVREDALLGPVFAIVQNWDEHLAKLKDFWSSVVLMSGRYHGSPMRAHVPLAWSAIISTAGSICSSRPRARSVRRRRPRSSSTRRDASPTVLRWRRRPSPAVSLRRVTCSGPDDSKSACKTCSCVALRLRCAANNALHQFPHHRSDLQNHHADRATRRCNCKYALERIHLRSTKASKDILMRCGANSPPFFRQSSSAC